MKNAVGPAIFNAQYQQDPDAPDGGLFKRKYFAFVDKPPAIARGTLFVSIDSAASTLETADYTAISLVLGLEGLFYVLHAERGRWDLEALVSKVWSYVKLRGTNQRPVHFVVENASTGISLISHLRASINRGDGRLRCFSYLPRQAGFSTDVVLGEDSVLIGGDVAGQLFVAAFVIRTISGHRRTVGNHFQRGPMSAGTRLVLSSLELNHEAQIL
jgi:phage terminase large subunit-like protein